MMTLLLVLSAAAADALFPQTAGTTWLYEVQVVGGSDPTYYQERIERTLEADGLTWSVHRVTDLGTGVEPAPVSLPFAQAFDAKAERYFGADLRRPDVTAEAVAGADRNVDFPWPLGEEGSEVLAGDETYIVTAASERVVVPAGEFECVRLRRETRSDGELIGVDDLFLRPGIGFVRSDAYDVEDGRERMVSREWLMGFWTGLTGDLSPKEIADLSNRMYDDAVGTRWVTRNWDLDPEYGEVTSSTLQVIKQGESGGNPALLLRSNFRTGTGLINAIVGGESGYEGEVYDRELGAILYAEVTKPARGLPGFEDIGEPEGIVWTWPPVVAKDVTAGGDTVRVLRVRREKCLVPSGLLDCVRIDRRTTYDGEAYFGSDWWVPKVGAVASCEWASEVGPITSFFQVRDFRPAGGGG